MHVIADLQLHSRFSRAVSKEMTIPNISAWAKRKGIGLIATGDWMHPLWMKEIQESLEEQGNGLLRLKPQKNPTNQTNTTNLTNGEDPLFMLATEVSCIYSQGGKGRRVHTLIWVPSLDSALKINQQMTKQGCNLMSDGRPIVGLSSISIAELVFTIEPTAMIIPAHCLLPDSMILGSDFVPKRIDAIGEGDAVLTHSGELHVVTEVKKRAYKGSVFHIRPWYFGLGLVTTPEHPYYAIKTLKKCLTTGDICRPSKSHLALCKRKTCLEYKPTWITAEKLEVGDVLVYPRSPVKTAVTTLIMDVTQKSNGDIGAGGSRGRMIANTLPITKELGRLIGYYLAEGSTDGVNSFSFCFSSDEQEYIDDVTQLVKDVFGIEHHRIYRRKDSHGVEIVFYSKLHAIWLAKECYGLGSRHNAGNKIIPSSILRSKGDVQAECLRGWWRGDHGYTTSRVLMNQMKAVCLRLGIVPSVHIDTALHHKSRGNHVLGTRIITANYDTYMLSNLAFFEDTFDLKKEIPRSQTKIDRKHGWIDKVNVYLPIKEITTKEYEGDVYNLEIEQDHSYVAEFAAVHNCWTPWFALYGSMSGFDSIDEAFGPYAKQIYAIETGLSSNPAMNWRIKELDHRSILSFSDAHSGPKLGREATVFDLPELSYDAIVQAIKAPSLRSTIHDLPSKIAYTLEFYPEEGKYHYTGHRACNIRWSPEETRTKGTTCPVCGKPLTQGVMQRVEELAGRSEADLRLQTTNYKLPTGNASLQMTYSEAFPHRPPFVMLVPLLEIIAEAIGSSTASQKAQVPYFRLIDALGGEFNVLLRSAHEEIAEIAGERVAVGVEKVRKGDIVIDPGYDGVFGVVKLWKEGEVLPLVDPSKEQLSLL